MKFDPSVIGVFGTPINKVSKVVGVVAYYRVEEQPGDGTKYAHNFLDFGDSFKVFGRIKGASGASLNEDCLVCFRDLEDIEPLLVGSDAYADAAIVDEYLKNKKISFGRNNIFTITSAIRCMCYVLRNYILKNEECNDLKEQIS